MTVSITGGAVIERGGGLFAKETLDQSTSAQAVALTTGLTVLSGGTASGNYTLAAGTEGQRKVVLMGATGNETLQFAGTATGALVFTDTDDIAELRFLDSKWRIVQNTATFGTST